MNQKTKKQLTYWLSVIVIGVTLGFALQFVRAWTEPPTGTTPPGGNLGAPINTSNVDQTKGNATSGKITAKDFCLNSDPTKCLSTVGGGTTSVCNNNGHCDAGENTTNCYSDCYVAPPPPEPVNPCASCGTCGSDYYYGTVRCCGPPDINPHMLCTASGWVCVSDCSCTFDCAG